MMSHFFDAFGVQYVDYSSFLTMRAMIDFPGLTVKRKVCLQHKESSLYAILWLNALRDLSSSQKASFCFAETVSYGMLFTNEASSQAIHTTLFSFNPFVNDPFVERSLEETRHPTSGVEDTGTFKRSTGNCD